MTAQRTEFNLSSVFGVIAAEVPDREAVVWRDRRLTFAQIDERINRFAQVLASAGLGHRRERSELAGHESGQDHVAIYLRNGNEWIETWLGAYRARTVPMNVNYRYVDEELLYLLNDSQATALVFHADFAPVVERVRAELPRIELLIQVADDSGNALLDGALAYEDCLAAAAPTPPPVTPMPDDLYAIYTGGTTGMPKGVLWRQHDIFVQAMGGRPFGSPDAMTSYEAVAENARNGGGLIRLLMIPPFMHGAAQWGSFHAFTNGSAVVIPDDVARFDAADALRIAEREKVSAIALVGDAMARPMIDELERNRYDLSSLLAISNGGAPMTPTVKARLLDLLPHVLLRDAVGSSETGIQMNKLSAAGGEVTSGTFERISDTVVVDATMTRILDQDDDEIGWLAQRGEVPLGYLGDAAKTARTFPVIEGVRHSIPGDRARLLPDGDVELLGRDAVTINSGGEKIFAEEVERAVAAHPGVSDVIVVGRPSERWGQEVVAIVVAAEGAMLDDESLLAECSKHLARYKLPKAFIVRDRIERSPAGKADYRWARAQAAAEPA